MRTAFFFLCLLSLTVSAQKPKAPVPVRAATAPALAGPIQTLPFSFGEIRVYAYAPNIYKIVVKANGDQMNDAFSDAVTARPLASGAAPLTAAGRDSFSVLGGRLLFTTYIENYYKGFRVYLREGEKIFGAGERALPLNRRGYRLALNNNPRYGYGEGADNLNYSVPFVTSSAGYGLFFDNPARSFVDIGKQEPNALVYGTPAGEWSMYLLLGNPAEVLAAYHKLTGTQPIPPRWAFGNLMSRFGYTSQAQVTEILGRMKQEGIPVEAVIFDLFWFGDSIKGTLGNLDWVNKKKWPDPAGMIAGFKKQGVKTILITEPFFVETSKNYKASKPYLAVDSAGRPYYFTDFYFGHGGLIDIFRKDAQAWFWSFYRRQMQLGVEGWWGDLGEPERHPDNMYHNLRDLGLSKRLYRAEEVHNLYGHTWTKMLYDFYAKEYPNKRLFSLNRSGFAGSQRYGIFPWTGDVGRNWSGLRAQLPVLLGMTMSGVPYVHSDAGGFAGGEGDGELYTRWLQFAAFTPIFRPHGTALYEVDKAAFSFPSEAALIDTPWRNYAKEAIRTRYELMPYNYSLAYLQAKEGKPLMAPLYFYNPTDTAAQRVEDEYYWGPSILVAPVLEKGARSRSVYLPAGQWLDANARLLEGGRRIEVPLTLDRIPVFVKAGSIVPGRESVQGEKLGPKGMEKTDDLAGGSHTLLYVPGPAGTFDWYLDDGESKNALSAGKHTLVRCNAQAEGNRIRLSISPSNSLFSVSNLQVMIPTLKQQPARLQVNGQAVEIGSSSAQWVADKNLLVLTIAGGTRKATVIEIE
ncbi:glycoside hydrolase family 31 protein [Flaviaesturariibacter flavus]|uniref:Glycoside hydrolase family 31 protein n=1 Tax=Flaviaesturariibacter flavus TaxID=2502780 RepID=A0A4R1B8H3_9BACT|nr:TIM-barrel domain-containing protein [Flaviaesturariibacter flavus]TCJ13338.1 glycoside hydrolase family 31 protein [Flaviaesturariibacter flavus]